MRNRRDFMKAMAAAAAGMSVAGRLTDEALAQGGAPKRREVFIGRKRIKMIDSHNHLNIADVARVEKGRAVDKNLSDPQYDVFWSKAQELGAFLFMHPGGTNGNGDPHFAGKGALGNTIGNPLETTIFFSRLIYDGTLDKFPGLKICGAHGGGYLPSYLGRTDAQCRRQDDVCTAKKRPVEDYFHTQLMADLMVF